MVYCLGTHWRQVSVTILWIISIFWTQKEIDIEGKIKWNLCINFHSLKWLNCKCLMDHNSSFQAGIKNCLLASETIVMHRLGDVWFFFFFCIENDRPKKLGKRNSPILRYCWSRWVLVLSLINGLSVEKKGKEACRPRNVSHFSRAARSSDFLDKPTFLRLHITPVLQTQSETL